MKNTSLTSKFKHLFFNPLTFLALLIALFASVALGNPVLYRYAPILFFVIVFYPLMHELSSMSVFEGIGILFLFFLFVGAAFMI